MDMSAAEGIAWELRGLLSFVALIAWCRWRGPPEDQKKNSRVPKRGERKQETVDQSVGSAMPSIRRARCAVAQSNRSANVSAVSR